MDDVVRLKAVDTARLVGWLEDAGEVLVAIDDIDGALKVKVDGRWSPPIGVLTSTGPAPVVDSARSNRDDERDEARVIRPAWWDRDADRPDPSEWRGADR